MLYFDPHKLAFLGKMLDANCRADVSIDKESDMKEDFKKEWEKEVAPRLCFNRFHWGAIILGGMTDGPQKPDYFVRPLFFIAPMSES